MPRWRQDSETGKLIPIDEAAAAHDSARGLSIVKGFEAYKSPIDGSIIRNHRDLERHNKKHNVVLQAEYGNDFFDRKAKERADYLSGNLSKKERFQRRQEIYEVITRLERNG